jgi:hypothetical protein
MTLDSRLLVNELNTAELCFEASTPYSSSGVSEAIYLWIQRPISYLALDLGGSVLDDLYAQSGSSEIVPMTESDLALEFEAWELLSDEALILFEEECC